MKKEMIWMGLLALMLSLGFASCGSDDDDENGGNDVSLKEQVIGTWELSEIYTANGWEAAAAAGWERTTATFGTNGSYKGTGQLGNGEGTYTVQGQDIVCTVKYTNATVTLKYRFEQLQGKTATVSLTMADGTTYRVRAIKQ